MRTPSPRSILIIRLGRLGDVVLTAALTRETKRAFPDANITFVTAPAYEALADLLPGIDKVVTIPKTGLTELREAVASSLPDSFDWVIDLHGNARSKSIAGAIRANRRSSYPKDSVRRRLLVWFKWGRGRGTPVWRRYLTPLVRAGVEPYESPPALLGGTGGGIPGAIVLAPGAGRPTKQWPVKKFKRLADNLLEAFPERTLLLVGGPGEEELLASVSTGGTSSVQILLAAPFPVLAAHLQDAATVITNDSGLLHFSEAVGTPVVALFGPTTEELGFAPAGIRSIRIEKDLACRPCSLHGSHTCPLPDRSHRCMEDISVEEVEAAVRETAGGPVN